MSDPITVDQFRGNFPAFADPAKFPATQTQFWLDLAYASFFNAVRWGNTIGFGVQLFVAHNLVLETQALASVKVNGNPGEYVGAVQSESVDKVSVNYDTGSTLEEGAGHWNLTTYGTRYIRLARMIGAGGLQLGVGCSPVFNGPAWPGPLTSLGPNLDG